MASPSSLASSLLCPLCHRTLDNPATLRCGHSLCARHLSAIPSQCPLSSCRIPTRAQIHIPEGVAFRSAQAAVTFPWLVGSAARDVTLQKILELVIRAKRRLRELSDGSPDDDDDTHSGDDSRPRKRQRQEEEPDLLSFLTSVLSRSVAPDDPLGLGVGPSDPGRPSDRDLFLDAFRKELQQELSCDICSEILYEPITTPCQHTYCKRCIQRSLDHQESCPQCRERLPNYSYFQDHPVNTTIHTLILKAFPDLYADRRTSIQEEERDAQLDTPIFVCGLYFPGQRCIIHIFEPRYRLMLRRCLEGDRPWFGMVMPPKAGMPNTLCDYGTMLRIQGVDMLQDGRSVVRTVGTFRFRITDRGSLDGYTVGKIEKIEDYPDTLMDAIDSPSTDIANARQPSPAPLLDKPSPSPSVSASASTPRADTAASSSASSSSPPHAPSVSSAMPPPPPSILRAGSNPSNAELMDICRLFMTRLQRGTAPWVVQQLANGAGDMPLDNPAMFSFWVAALLPIDELEKAKLLPIRSPRLRLLLVVHWIEQLNKQWWFTQGCTVL